MRVPKPEYVELIRRAQVGDASALDRLVRRFQDMAVGYAASVLGDFDRAQDAAQEAFVEACRDLSRLRDPAAFPSWFRHILFKQCDRITRVKRPPSIPLEAAHDVECPHPHPHDRLERRERESFLREALRAMPEGERTALTLYYMGGHFLSEIAGFLGVPVSTVKNRLHSARRRLKERLMEMAEEHFSEQRPSNGDRFARTVRLRSAVETGDPDTVRAILDADPALSRTVVYDRDPRGETFLHRVSGWGCGGEGHLAVAELLLKHGADVNALGWGDNNPECTPLMVAAWAGHAPLVNLLLASGADPNRGTDPVHKLWWNGDRMRPIETAAVHGHGEIVESLIRAGADYSLTHTVLAGLTDWTGELLERDPSLVNQPDQNSYPLHRALEWSFFPEMLRLLLGRGADVNRRDPKGNAPLHTALQSGKSEAVPILLQHGAEVDLFAAAGLSEVDRLREFLSEDPSRANERMRDGVTPLFYAANAGVAEGVRLLLECGAEVNLSARRDWRGWGAETPLLIAAMQGHVEVCRLLLEAGAAPEADGDVPALAWAARRGHTAIAGLLLAHGANPDRRQKGGLSPLDWAAWMGHVDAARLLLEHGAEVNGRAPAIESVGLPGRTALHYAAQHGRYEVAELLLENGADTELKDRNGDTPLSLALAQYHEEIAELLRRHSENRPDP